MTIMCSTTTIIFYNRGRFNVVMTAIIVTMLLNTTMTTVKMKVTLPVTTWVDYNNIDTRNEAINHTCSR